MAEVGIEDVVQKTLEELINNQLIPKYEGHKVYITKVLKEAAQMEATLTTKMVPMIDNDNMQEVETAISAIIGRRFVESIKVSFVIETYIMEVVKKSDGQSVVQVQRKGVKFHSEIMLMTTNDIDIATWLQLASLIIELLLFLLRCLGIGIDLSEDEMRTLAQEVERLAGEPAFQRALTKFVDAWNKAGGSAWRKAKAIFYFLKDIYSLGILWKIMKLIFKLIYQKLSSWEMIKAIIEVVLMIVAAFATEGLALIARIALAVYNDDQLAKKIANLVKFSDMKKALAAVGIEVAVHKTLEELIKYLSIPKRFKREIREVLIEAAKKEATLKTKMVPMIDNKNMQDVEREMSAIIGQTRVDLIKKSFAIETYTMQFAEKRDGQSVVQIHRKGKEFQPERMLMSIKEIQSATELQWASLVVELFIFVLNCVGIGVDLSEDEMRTLVQKVESLVQELKFQEALINFVDAWNKAGDNAWGKARAVFSFLADIYELNLFWTIIKLIVDDMSTWETFRALAEVALTIVAAFATDGLALIARIALAVNSAVHLAEKIANLNTFSEMKKTMK